MEIRCPHLLIAAFSDPGIYRWPLQQYRYLVVPKAQSFLLRKTRRPLTAKTCDLRPSTRNRLNCHREPKHLQAEVSWTTNAATRAARSRALSSTPERTTSKTHPPPPPQQATKPSLSAPAAPRSSASPPVARPVLPRAALSAGSRALATMMDLEEW
jgi:hypothetical protein